MFELYLYGSAIAIVTGVLLGSYVHFSPRNNISIPPVEYGICGAVLLLLLVPLTSYVGYQFALSEQTTYREYWGGYENRTYQNVYQCHESSEEGGSTGGCTHYYDCDSYTVEVDDSYTDDKGKTHKRTKKVTKYRQCPYTTTEIDWMIRTTVGDFNVGPHWLPENPDAHRLSPRHDWFKASLPGNLDSGTPSPWTSADRRLAAGTPAPVAAEKDYTNWILASDDSVLVTHSQDIKRYTDAGLLPDINHDVHDVYFLDRAYFVGVTVPNPQQWQRQLARFNAALGSSLQGNLYLVIVDANKVSRDDSQAYIMALMAYWQSEKFDKYALSKNGIVVVVGTTDGTTVAWSKAGTGMPKGNEALVHEFERELVGKELSPRTLLGDPTIELPPKEEDGKFVINLIPSEPKGAIESLLWGANKFERVHMSYYAYLKGQITLSAGSIAGVLAVIFLVSLAAWGFIAYHGAHAYRRFRVGGSFR